MESEILNLRVPKKCCVKYISFTYLMIYWSLLVPVVSLHVRELTNVAGLHR